MIAVVQDQPERRSFNYLKLGGTGCHGRWGYSVDIFKIKSKLIPCIDCKRNLFAQTPTFAPRNCGQCHCWFSNNSDVWFEPEEHFPKEKLSIDGTIPMRKLDYKHLCEVVNTTHDKVVEGEWTTGEARAYLSTNCFNTIARDEIMKCATNCKLKRNAERDHDMATLESILLFYSKTTPTNMRSGKCHQCGNQVCPSSSPQNLACINFS